MKGQGTFSCLVIKEKKRERERERGIDENLTASQRHSKLLQLGTYKKTF